MPSPSHGDRTIDVLLVDPLPVVRLGMKGIFAAEPDIRVVGECGCAAEALRLAVALRPRVVIVDLLSDAEGGAGFGLIKDLRVQAPAARALVCSAAPLAALTVTHLLAIGARGYARKDAPLERLPRAVRVVAAGEVSVAPDAAEAIIAGLAHAPTRRRRGRMKRGSRAIETADGTDLTRRAALLSGCEVEVLHMIGLGQTSRAIAAILHKSIKTIQTYRSRIRAKLHLDGPTALAQLAWRWVHGAGTSAA